AKPEAAASCAPSRQTSAAPRIAATPDKRIIAAPPERRAVCVALHGASPAWRAPSPPRLKNNLLVGAGQWQWHRAVPIASPRLVREQDRNRRLHDDMARGAAEDQLPEPALGIGPLDEQVGIEGLRLLEEGLARGSSTALYMARPHREPMQREGARQLLAGRTR